LIWIRTPTGRREAVTVAIDPGFTRIDGSRTKWIDRSALAWFEGSRLVHAEYFADMKASYPTGPDVIVIEKPTVYPSNFPGAPRVPPNDIVDLAWAGAMLAGRFRCGAVVELLAQAWKLQMAKPVCHARALRVLTPDETLLLPVGSVTRIQAASRVLGVTGKCPAYRWRGVDVLDAVSLGLVHLGRLDLGGTKT
jgi:hypothetical protein